MRLGGTWFAMRRSLRNAGYPGLGAMALSAVDIALWDLRCRLLDIPLAAAVGGVHVAVPLYGSGGFCSYSDAELAEQLAGWVEAGIPRVKMKVGRDPERDVERVRVARSAIGDEAELFVDANGALTRKLALGIADRFAELGVSWFEEPVSSNDLGGLRFLRERGPGGMDIAAGESAYELRTFDGCSVSSTACRRTSRAAAASRDCSLPPPSPTRARSTSPDTARRRSTPTRSAASAASVTRSTSTTTF